MRWCGMGIILLALAGCGFHLRQENLAVFPSDIQIVCLTYATTVDMAQQQALSDALISAGVQPTETASLQVIVSDAATQTEPLAFGIDSEVHRERIMSSLTFRVVREGQILIPAEVVTASQERIRYTHYDLADASEKERITAHLQKVVAEQLVTRVAAHLNSTIIADPTSP